MALGCLLTIIFSHLVNRTISVACVGQSNEEECNLALGCSWQIDDLNDNNELCECASSTKLDIIFGIDNSVSNTESFETIKELIKHIILYNVASDARIGFTLYDDTVTISAHLQHWITINSIHDHIKNNLYENIKSSLYIENDIEGVILNILTQFSDSYNSEREQILILISNDGISNPVCQIVSEVESSNIRIIVIGIGDSTPLYLSCLLKNDQDFIYLEQLTLDIFDSILDKLMPIICPITRDLKITEIKPSRNRFIEIFNNGNSFDASSILLEGTMITGTGPINTMILTNQYLVFYDGEINIPRGGRRNNNNPNAIYIECGDLLTCSFKEEEEDNSSFEIIIRDKDTLKIIDAVSKNERWIDIDLDHNGYSYQLINKEYNTSYGDNWSISCKIYGTPGYDPLSSCDTLCTLESCQPFNCIQDVTLSTSTSIKYGICDCTSFGGLYYPNCNTGGSCIKCKLIPKISTCNIKLIKNQSDNIIFATYSWDKPEIDLIHSYKLSYFAASLNGLPLDIIISNNDLREITISDYYDGYSHNIGGYVNTIIDIFGYEYKSDVTWCHINELITISPTISPSISPTNNICCDCLNIIENGGCDNDLECQIEVCDLDPFCCTSSWDTICTLQARSICNDQPLPPCCSCAVSTDHGCNDNDCTSLICPQDPFCCQDDNSWDSICVSSAYDLCEGQL